MCGIVGAVATRPIAGLLIDGLKKLEYRGYDSAGIVLLNDANQLQRLRVVGKVRELEIAMQEHTLNGQTGVAHTRWATHGAPSEKNAHPFISHDEFALVHNGIIENHDEIRDELIQLGYQFISDTDTEVIVHLVHYYHSHNQQNDFLTAVRKTVSRLKGAYALGVVAKNNPKRLIAVRQGSPLVIGLGQGENFVASDPLALLAITQKFIYLEDQDLVDITHDTIKIYQNGETPVQRLEHVLMITQDATERGDYRHFMKKEIMEQPDAIRACLSGRLMQQSHSVLANMFGPKASEAFAQVEHIQLVACGTSYHAALVARYWFESLLNIPTTVEIASEYRYRSVAPIQNSLYVTLSQSGETADTLAALRFAKNNAYLETLAICNVPGSSMVREAGMSFLTCAGVEIGVASTKAFTTQLVSLFLLALAIRVYKNKVSELDQELVKALNDLPRLIQEVLQQDDDIASWAYSFTQYHHALFLGRGTLYPIALEGALKMKEISYIHAEGYPGGELKHGPLALVDAAMPVVVTLPSDALFEKTLSNLQEVRARGGQLTIFTDQKQLLNQVAFVESKFIFMPKVHALLAPILYTIPLQLLAYHVAVLKGTDVDQPRNLAKSVTVE